MDILLGARYLLTGFSMIVRPGLRRFFVVPLIVNVLIFAALIWLAVDQFGTLMDWLLPSGDAWWAVLSRVALWLLFAAAALLILFFAFSVVANLIAAPFNGLLSEKVAELLTGKKPSGGLRRDFDELSRVAQSSRTEGLRAALADILPSILNELRKLVYFLALAVPILILAIIPGLNLLFPALWIALTAWMLAQEYLSYPMENEGLRFREARQRMVQKRAMSFGFGLAVVAATIIPLVNFLVMPAAVAGATVMWVEEWKTADAVKPRR